jgi:putative addiction module antidote
MYQSTVKKVGKSLGITLPAEIVKMFNIKAGAKLKLSLRGSILLIDMPDSHFKRKMQLAKRLMKRYDNALRELAKH